MGLGGLVQRGGWLQKAWRLWEGRMRRVWYGVRWRRGGDVGGHAMEERCCGLKDWFGE